MHFPQACSGRTLTSIPAEAVCPHLLRAWENGVTHHSLLTGTLFVLASSSAVAAESGPKWISEGPYVDESSFSFELPMEYLAGKVFVEVEVGGVARRFLFDTGSPSMMSKQLAAQLALEVVDKRQGRDSHGALVQTDIVQSDLTIGGTTFHKVPIFAADLPHTAQCLFDGVLGSELLPLCAWQIDVPDSVLRCTTEPTRLDHVDEAAAQPLHDFGYPHAPILDVRFASKATSKALFDTGSPEYVAISPPDLEGASRNRGVGRTVLGAGSLGGSLGGRAPDTKQRQVELKSFGIGDMPLGRVGSVLRESAPSLVGASILEHFVVTLDAKNSKAYFDRFRDGPFVRSSFGFGLAFEPDAAISLVWDGSPAAEAGLRVGQRVTAINAKPTAASCDGIRSAMRAMADGSSIDIEWDGGAATLVREPAFR